MNKRSTIVAFLTGQSDPTGNALTVAQLEFLKASPAASGEILELNFPYEAAGPRFRRMPLWRASLNNAMQYLGSRRAAFRLRHREPFIEKFSPYERVILLAGSCGLELLVNLQLPEALRAKLHVFAFGPVSRSLPEVGTLWLVQGKRDLISRGWHRRPDYLIDCHHLNYLEAEETRTLFVRFYHSVTRS